MATDKSDELYKVLIEKGFHDSLCKEIAYKYMNTDYTATRMLGYLYRYSTPREADVVDEMLAILEDRERFRKKHETEEAQAKITEMYNHGLNGQL